MAAGRFEDDLRRRVGVGLREGQVEGKGAAWRGREEWNKRLLIADVIMMRAMYIPSYAVPSGPRSKAVRWKMSSSLVGSRRMTAGEGCLLYWSSSLIRRLAAMFESRSHSSGKQATTARIDLLTGVLGCCRVSGKWPTRCGACSCLCRRARSAGDDCHARWCAGA